jgi:hypothetical protein
MRWIMHGAGLLFAVIDAKADSRADGRMRAD